MADVQSEHTSNSVPHAFRRSEGLVTWCLAERRGSCPASQPPPRALSCATLPHLDSGFVVSEVGATTAFISKMLVRA